MEKPLFCASVGPNKGMQSTSNFTGQFDFRHLCVGMLGSAAQAGHSLHYVVLELPVNLKRPWKTIGRIKTYFKDAAQTYMLDLFIGQRVQLPRRAR